VEYPANEDEDLCSGNEIKRIGKTSSGLDVPVKAFWTTPAEAPRPEQGMSLFFVIIQKDNLL